MFEIGKKFKFEAAHHLQHHKGKCHNLHGHSYHFELIVAAEELKLHGSDAGMVEDYDKLSAAGKLVEDKFDHKYINSILDSDTTTAEELAIYIYQLILPILPNLIEVRVSETEKTFASYRPQRKSFQMGMRIAEKWIDSVKTRLYNGADTSNELGCWIFAGGKDKDGYGWFSIPMAGIVKAHRASAWLDGQDIEGLIVMHSCDNPPCVNPRHIFAATHLQNEVNKDLKARRPTGEKANAAKLTEEQVLEILALLNAGEDRVAIALKFDVSTSLIYAIKNGRVWSYITKIPRK